MKRSFFIFILLFCSNLHARSHFLLELENGALHLYGEVYEHEDQTGFSVTDVSVTALAENISGLKLNAEFGWGDTPYSILCEKLSLELYGDTRFAFTSAYGFLEHFGLLQRWLSTPRTVVINKDQTFDILDSSANSSYDSGFSCYAHEMTY